MLAVRSTQTELKHKAVVLSENMNPDFEIKGNSVKNTQCLLVKRPVGDIKDDDVQVREINLGSILT